MPVYNEGLTLNQSGREATKGTAVAATSKLAVQDFKITPVDEFFRPVLAKGLVLANRGNELAVHRGVTWEIPDTPLVYDQLQQFLAMTYKGGIAPTGVGPYVWTYPRDPTIAPVLDSRTFEKRQTDGTTPNDWEFAYGMLQRLTIKGGQNQPVIWSASGFGRRLQSSTLTAAQALPAIVEAPVALCTVYIDTTWGGLGGTIVTAQVLEFEYTIETGEKPIMTADARGDLDFTVDVIDAAEVKHTLNMLILANAAGQWATEKTAAEAGTLRAIEVRNVVSATATLKVQGLFKHAAASSFPDEMHEGQRAARLQLEGSSDDTNFAQAILTNNTATMV